MTNPSVEKKRASIGNRELDGSFQRYIVPSTTINSLILNTHTVCLFVRACMFTCCLFVGRPIDRNASFTLFFFFFSPMHQVPSLSRMSIRLLIEFTRARRGAMICVSPSGGKKAEPQRSRRVNKNDINNIAFCYSNVFLSLSLSTVCTYSSYFLYSL